MINETEHMPGGTSQTERIATLRQDANLRQQQQASTLHQHAQAQADELSQGRFRATGTPSVTGTTAAPAYPPGPAWCADPTGVEAPLGYAIDEMQPVGEAHEVRVSIAAQDTRPLESVGAQGNSGDATAAPANPPSGSMSKRVASPPFSKPGE